MEILFKPEKTDKVIDLTVNPGFDIKHLLKRFGPDVTWKQIFLTDDRELVSIPGYGRETVNRIKVFISENFEFTFNEFLSEQ